MLRALREQAWKYAGSLKDVCLVLPIGPFEQHGRIFRWVRIRVL
jgi:hypothetical protein